MTDIPGRLKARRHAETRAAQRYGVGPEVVEAVEAEIRRALRHQREFRRLGHSNGRPVMAWCIGRQTDGRSRWRVVVDGVAMRAIYDDGIRAVVTVLPPHDERTTR